MLCKVINSRVESKKRLNEIWEWVGDWYDRYYYRSSPFVNPRGLRHGTALILKGRAIGPPF